MDPRRDLARDPGKIRDENALASDCASFHSAIPPPTSWRLIPDKFIVPPNNNVREDVCLFARGETPDVGLLDARRLRRVPFYPLREPAVRLVAGCYQFLDAIGR